MAEWLCSGLQIRVRRFDSDLSLHNNENFYKRRCRFFGFHLSNSLLGKDTEILGVDNLNSYYDTKLKKRRLENLLFKDNFKFLQVDLLNQDNLKSCFADFNPDIVINLAAQAGVRYSLINPSSYLDSNILSFLHILNLSEVFEVERFIYASSSSVYGDEKIPSVKILRTLILLPYMEKQN